MSKEYEFITKHSVVIEADSKEEAIEIYENLDDYGDISDVEIKENDDDVILERIDEK